MKGGGPDASPGGLDAGEGLMGVLGSWVARGGSVSTFWGRRAQLLTLRVSWGFFSLRLMSLFLVADLSLIVGILFGFIVLGVFLVGLSFIHGV